MTSRVRSPQAPSLSLCTGLSVQGNVYLRVITCLYGARIAESEGSTGANSVNSEAERKTIYRLPL